MLSAASPTPLQHIIIIGAGVAGSALAHSLSSKFSITLIERDFSEPDRIVGELLQPGGIHALHHLKLSSCVEKIDGIRTNGYVLFYKGQEATLSYPEGESGVSFHHGRFVMNLRAKAKEHSNVHCVQASASELIYEADTCVGVTLNSGEEIRGDLVVIADGCFSKFRKEVSEKKITSNSSFVGMILEECDLPVPGHGHVVLCDPAPVLFYQIASRETRVLIDIPGKLPSQADGSLQTYLLNHISPQLPKRIQPSFNAAIKQKKIRSMPNSTLAACTNTKRGVFMLGDAMNMRHPLTGGGMTVALWDVVHLSKLLNKMQDVTDVAAMKHVARQLVLKRRGRSGVIGVLAHGLYSLFSAGDCQRTRRLREACFVYLGYGGWYAEMPVALLAGLIPNPMVLVLHFFLVAFLAMWMCLHQGVMGAFECVAVLAKACQVIFPAIYAEIIQ